MLLEGGMSWEQIGLSPREMEWLEGKKITLFYAKSWTPLAPFGTCSKHITRLNVNDSVVFSEW
jgi:hypothetical protein